MALHRIEVALTLLVSLHRRARRQQAIEPKIVVTEVPCRASWWRTLASPTLAVAWSAWYRMTSLRTRRAAQYLSLARAQRVAAQGSLALHCRMLPLSQRLLQKQYLPMTQEWQVGARSSKAPHSPLPRLGHGLLVETFRK